MTMINISEGDFEACASAAIEALRRGDRKEAEALDKLARKINAALANKRASSGPFGRLAKGMTWEDVPSVLRTYEASMR